MQNAARLYATKGQSELAVEGHKARTALCACAALVADPSETFADQLALQVALCWVNRAIAMVATDTHTRQTLTARDADRDVGAADSGIARTAQLTFLYDPGGPIYAASQR